MPRGSRVVRALLLCAVLASAACTGPWRADTGVHWVASWGAAQMAPDASDLLRDELWRDASLRQIVRVSLGGSRLRVRLSNAFGTTPLEIAAASIACAQRAGLPDTVPGSQRILTFGGKASVTIPAGAEIYTDVVDLAHEPRADLAITLHFKHPPAQATGHPASWSTSFGVRGNRVAEETWTGYSRFVRWYQLSGVEVEAPREAAAVVAIGDSLTDGAGSTTDRNDRWTDFLAARLEREGRMAVVNAGLGGNRLLLDGVGPSLLSRFDRDVLARSGATHAIVHVGVNDLGGQHLYGEDSPEGRAKLLEDMKAGFRTLVERAHARGICVIGGTILPYRASLYFRPGAENEADRLALNRWIRTSAVFDAVADFDAAVRDPANQDRLRPEFDSGDGLHPSPAGYRAMAEAVPLAGLGKCRFGPDSISR